VKERELVKKHSHEFSRVTRVTLMEKRVVVVSQIVMSTQRSRIMSSYGPRIVVQSRVSDRLIEIEPFMIMYFVYNID
jgi:hypothetical protein